MSYSDRTGVLRRAPISINPQMIFSKLQVTSYAREDTPRKRTQVAGQHKSTFSQVIIFLIASIPAMNNEW